MERSRTAPPISPAEISAASLPADLPSLEVLVQMARAPDAARLEVDALLSGLSQPLSAEHSPRERADLLLSLLEDQRLADFTGSNGRTVRTATVEALMSLGYPYALEIPPEALEARTGEQGPGAGTSNLLSTSKGRWGLGLVVLAGVLQALPVLYWGSDSPSAEQLMLVVLAIIAGTTFVPAALTVTGHNTRSNVLKIVGTVWLVIASLLWIIPSLLLMTALPLNLIPLAMGGLILAGAILMNSDS